MARVSYTEESIQSTSGAYLLSIEGIRSHGWVYCPAQNRPVELVKSVGLGNVAG